MTHEAVLELVHMYADGYWSREQLYERCLRLGKDYGVEQVARSLPATLQEEFRIRSQTRHRS